VLFGFVEIISLQRKGVLRRVFLASHLANIYWQLNQQQPTDRTHTDAN